MKKNLLTIYITQACNIYCKACPLGKWKYSIEDVRNALTNALLLPWLKKYCSPDKWYIEIVGGEPSLYPEIVELMYWLEKEDYRGIIKTNGILFIPKVKGLKRITAWHKEWGGADKPPNYYDTILILKNPTDDWKAKVKYCEDNGIPHKAVLWNDYSKPKKEWAKSSKKNKKIVLENTILKNWSVVFSMGHLGRCVASGTHHLETIQNDCPPLLQDISTGRCRTSCGDLDGFLRFFKEEEVD